jgi:hypothetical protein
VGSSIVYLLLGLKYDHRLWRKCGRESWPTPLRPASARTPR